MRVDEVLQIESSDEIMESFAIAKIRKEVTKYSGKNANVKILQSPKKRSHYRIFVEDDGKVKTVEMIDGKFDNTSSQSLSSSAKEITMLELRGWADIDPRSWVEKHKTALIMGAAGLTTAIALGSAGLIPVTAVLMPIISTFLGVFGSLFKDNISAPLSTSD